MIRRLVSSSPIGRRIARRRRKALIAGSDWFDPTHYADLVGDLGGVGAIDHFVDVGEPAGVDPHPDFSTADYVVANPEATGGALTHFLRTMEAAGNPGLRPADVIDTRLPALVWFDAPWYVARHDLGRLPVHPYAHYRSVGAAAGLAPGPLFDGAEYGERHDLGGLDPVSHWLTVQPDDGPVATTLRGPVRGPRQLGRPRLVQRQRLASISVCVVVHAFYIDTLAELLGPLAAVPGGCTVLVSVVSDDDAVAAERTISEVLGPDQQRVVRVVENRGRNFAPLLVGFADELANHDVVLHLHTKKSLYTGSEARSWRGHLLRHLVGTPAVVEAILGCFAGDDEIGVVQPPPYDGLPQWANHWLGNSGRGRQLLERMGLDPASGGGYVDYPIGGMFWARTAALAPLLQLGLAVDHFEEEVGQTDRTLAHTLERLIGFSARAAGYRLVEFDADGFWRVGWSTRGIDRFGTVGRSELAAAVDGADLVSVDLFDTLLLRPSFDADVLRAVAMRRLGPDGSDLLDRRIAAEGRARSMAPPLGDSSMTEIYAEAVAESPELADRFSLARDTEIEVERRGVVAREWLVAELRRLKCPGLRYVLMTDTFLERPMIDELLQRIDASDLFDEIFVSNEVGARKDSGGMWALVAEREHCPPERWVHLGDNEFSDVQQAADRGIAAVHVPSAGAVASVGGFSLGEVRAECRELTSIVAGSGIAGLLAARPVRDTRSIEEFGYGVVGPITFAFVRWLVDSARRDGIDRLLFAARDGELPLRVLEACRPAWPGPVPPAAYLSTSRRASFRLARRPGGGIDDVLDAGPFRGTMAELFQARLGWTVGPSIADLRVELPTDREMVRSVIGEELASIEALGAADRPAFVRHLSELGVRPGDRLGLVDLGYSATTQRSLSAVLDQELSGYYAVTTAVGSATPRTRSCFGSDVVWDDEVVVHQRQRIFEMVWSAAHGQVDHLELVDGRVVVVTDERTRRDSATRDVISRVQEAALDYTRELLDRHGDSVLDLPLDAAAVGRAVGRAMLTLVPDPDGLFEAIRLDDHFSGLPSLTMVATERPL